MPSGGYRPGAGRPKGSKSVKAEPANKRKAASSAPAPGPEDSPTKPLEYMLAVMRDPKADEVRRDRMAIAAAPFVHEKVDKKTAKERAAEASKTAAQGRYAPGRAPGKKASAEEASKKAHLCTKWEGLLQ